MFLIGVHNGKRDELQSLSVETQPVLVTIEGSWRGFSALGNTGSATRVLSWQVGRVLWVTEHRWACVAAQI